MSRQICLVRDYLGMNMRIEARIMALAGGNGRWALFCAAGLNGAQPSDIKVQGPFLGAAEATRMLQAIIDNLREQGYREVAEEPIWRLHMQARLRQLNGRRSGRPGPEPDWSFSAQSVRRRRLAAVSAPFEQGFPPTYQQLAWITRAHFPLRGRWIYFAPSRSHARNPP